MININMNQGDLVNEEQQSDILDKIVLLNPKAKIVKTVQSKINVMDILNTRLYEANKETEDFWVTASKVAAEEKEKFEAEMEDCCQKTLTNEGKKCCKSNKDKLLDTGLSQVGKLHEFYVKLSCHFYFPRFSWRL